MTAAAELDLTRAAQRFRREREAMRAARAELERLVVAAVADGMSINGAAKLTGLQRLEVRRMLNGVRSE